MNANKFCEECNITGHTKEKCWKAHPELFPKKWIKDDRMKRAATTTFDDDTIELRSINEADKSLSLMAGPQKNSQNTQVKSNEKELFLMKIQVKHEVIAIVDTGSQKNLISASLVRNWDCRRLNILLHTRWAGSAITWIHNSKSNVIANYRSLFEDKIGLPSKRV
nr:hypothetical protein [Tanacetum cinerariifolium]